MATSQNSADAHIIEFIANCYKSDNREQQVSNYFSAKVQYKKWITDVGILNGELNGLPIETHYAEKVNKELEKYKHEKSLFIAAMFLVGKGRKGKINAPLFLIPADINKNEEGYSVAPDFTSISLNPAFFSAINATNGNDFDAIKKIQGIIKNRPFDFEEIAKVQRVFADTYKDVNSKDLLLFPNLISENVIKRIAEFNIVSGAGFCVLKKSASTVNILRELTELADAKDLSLPINEFLSFSSGVLKSENQKYNYTPSALSIAQLKAVKNANTYSTSVIIGPPGTGKSYTIAAIAINAIMQGKSILITSAKNKAVDVVQQKLEQDFELREVPIRAGGKGDYKALLKTRIDNMLSGIGSVEVDRTELLELEKQVGKLLRKLAKTEKKYLKQSAWAKRASKKYLSLKRGLFKSIMTVYLRSKSNTKTPIYQLLFELEAMYPKKYEQIKKLIKLQYNIGLQEVLDKNRQLIRKFSTAIRSRTIQTREQRFLEIDFEVLKRVFPVWLVNLNEAPSVLPFRKEFFDLVVIDEASQCDIASALPLMHRAKQVVICGDPKQLRHVSFLSNAKVEKLAEGSNLNLRQREKFNYKSKSVLDLALENIKAQDGITFLNEHFRSKPDIISFSNIHFYAQKLRLMTEQPFVKHNASLFFHKTDGTRKDGVNTIEADFIIRRIKEIIEHEKVLEPDFKRSIGVLSPFRDQVDYLEELIYKSIPGEHLIDHSISIGTAHSFQGKERDIMFISFSVDDISHPTAINHLNQADVFNVSITRARNEQHIVYSRKKELFKAHSLMWKYLSQDLENATKKQQGLGVENDDFAKEVVAKLANFGYDETHVGYPIMGIPFDIVVRVNNRLYGIDLIGYTGQMEDVLELDKIKIFKRAGNSVFSLPYHQWLFNRDRVEQALRYFLK